ncbi:MAG: hypothetical protein ACRD2P_15815 [Terriglobia bacterium]
MLRDYEGALVIDSLLVHGLQYASYAVELVLVILLLMRSRWRDAKTFSAYIFGYFAVDAILRPAVLYTFGFASLQYRYVYWVSDILLTLGAFLLICFFFRRACSDKPEVWSYLRSMLAAVFVIIAFISYFSLTSHYGHLFSRFIVDLQQNLYFSCLVLNTLLYIMLQQWDSVDEKLSLLVCGFGIGFAGPAANMALMYLTPGGRDAGILLTLITPLCSLGMCMVWMYAVAHKATSQVAVQSQKDVRAVPAFAEVPMRGQ